MYLSSGLPRADLELPDRRSTSSACVTDCFVGRSSCSSRLRVSLVFLCVGGAKAV